MDAVADADSMHKTTAKASTPRTSRAGRPPAPTKAVEDTAWRRASARAGALQDMGYVRAPKVWPVRFKNQKTTYTHGGGPAGAAAVGLTGAAAHSYASGEAMAAAAAATCGPSPSHSDTSETAHRTHILRLHSQGVESAQEAKAPQWISYAQSLPPRNWDVVAVAMKSATYRGAVTNKQAGQGSTQQTPRINRMPVLSAWATEAVSVATTLALAEQQVRAHAAAKHVAWGQPACTGAVDPAALVDGCDHGHESEHGIPAAPAAVADGESPFVHVSTSRLIQHALPCRLRVASLLQTAKALANNQLLNRVFCNENHPLDVVCTHITTNVSGMNVWAAWALVKFLVTEPRLRVHARTHFSDSDVAVAVTCLSYGEKEIQWREGHARKASVAGAGAGAGASASGDAPSPSPGTAPARRGRLRAPSPTATPTTASASASASAPLPLSPSSASSTSTALAVVPSSDDEEAHEHDGVGILAGMARTPRGTGTGLAADRGFCEHTRTGVYGIATQELAFWAHVCSYSKHKATLQMMITQRLSAVEAATVETIANQSAGGSGSAELLGPTSTVLAVGRSNAVASAKMVAGLIQTTEQEVPRAVAWTARSGAGLGGAGVAVGFARSEEDARHTMLHACVAAPRGLRPARAHLVCAWSLTQRLLTPATPETTLVPGLVETERYAALLQAHMQRGGDPREVGFAGRERVNQALARLANVRNQASREGSVRMSNTGVARGVITIRATCVVNASQMRQSALVANQMRDLVDRVSDGRHTRAMPNHVAARMLAEEPLNVSGEPLVTPASNLVLALEVDALIRKIPTKDRRNHPCLRLCAPTTESELQNGSDDAGRDDRGAKRSAGAEKHTHTTYDFERPACILPIIDMSLRLLDGEADAVPIPSRPQDARLRTAAVTLTVAGDCPVRAVDIASNFAGVRAELRAKHGRRSTDEAKVRLHTRALLLAAAARASEINDLGRALGAGDTNSRIAQTKRDTKCDLTLNPFATLFDVYRVGHTAPRSYATSSHAGSYPAGFDLGLMAHVGVRAFKYTTDGRGHGNMQVSQSTVDNLALRFADRLWMPVREGVMDKIPVEARGIVHFTVPMLHKYLDDLVEGMELARAVMGIENRSTCDSLQCLAYTPFADRRTSWAGPDNDSASVRFRNPLDAEHHENKAYTLDATVDDLSILDEDAFPRQSVTCAADNLFETPDLFVATFRNVAALLGRLAVDATPGGGAQAVAALYDLCCAFHACDDSDGDTSADNDGAPDFLYAADALVLLCLLYPIDTEIGEPTVDAAWAAAPSRLYCAVRGGGRGRRLHELGLPDEDVRVARERWARFQRADPGLCPWRSALAPLVAELVDSDGCFDSSLEDVARMRALLARAMKHGAFLVASADGRQPPFAPSALANVRGPHQVRAEHLRPVFAGREIGASGRRVEARGPVAGAMPMGSQLVLHFLIGARKAEDDDYEEGCVDAQYQRNEGGTAVRPSSCAYFETAEHKKRSAKGMSPISNENDHLAFGDAAEKERLAYKCLRASDANIAAAAALLLSIAPPNTPEVRRRGDWQLAEMARQIRCDYTADKVKATEQLKDDALFATAAAAAAAAAATKG